MKIMYRYFGFDISIFGAQVKRVDGKLRVIKPKEKVTSLINPYEPQSNFCIINIQNEMEKMSNLNSLLISRNKSIERNRAKQSSFFDYFAIKDMDYLNFIKNDEGGYFFDDALLLYSVNANNEFEDIEAVTAKTKQLYGFLDAKFHLSIGEDIFCNQFIIIDEGFAWLDIESGEVELLSDSFQGFIDVILSDVDYYTGRSFLKSWRSVNHSMRSYLKLTPKIPFVLGGSFSIDNIYESTSDKILSFNADLAFQMYKYPDGEKIKIIMN